MPSTQEGVRKSKLDNQKSEIINKKARAGTPAFALFEGWVETISLPAPALPSILALATRSARQ